MNIWWHVLSHLSHLITSNRLLQIGFQGLSEWAPARLHHTSSVDFWALGAMSSLYDSPSVSAPGRGCRRMSVVGSMGSSSIGYYSGKPNWNEWFRGIFQIISGNLHLTRSRFKLSGCFLNHHTFSFSVAWGGRPLIVINSDKFISQADPKEQLVHTLL